MKKGIIVYLTNSVDLPENFDADEVLAGLTLSSDRTVLAAAAEGFWNVSEALHLLLTKGMQHITCVKARLNELGYVEVYGEPLRLYG